VRSYCEVLRGSRINSFCERVFGKANYGGKLHFFCLYSWLGENLTVDNLSI